MRTIKQNPLNGNSSEAVVLEQALKKSLWRNSSNQAWSFFCPLCRANRKVACHPRPKPIHYAQVALSSVVFMLATWSWFDWKGIVSFVPLWAAFEVVYRSRVRVALNCPHCGFDPYLYLVDIKRAREEIEAHWRKKFAEKGVPFPEKEKPAHLKNTAAGAASGAGQQKEFHDSSTVGNAGLTGIEAES